MQFLCRCEAPLLQCCLAYNVLTNPVEPTRSCVGVANETEPLVFSSYTRVSKCKALLCTTKEQNSHCTNLLRSILVHMKCDQSSDDENVIIQLNRILFVTAKLFCQKKLSDQSKELLGDAIYFHCLSARQNYSISPSDEKWIVLFWLMTLLDQKQWNLFAFVASKVC